ncbi:type I secretion system permease/ATPase [Bosea sp. (in: a-proteobacteria)]|uniref:type I secretion system permease/ATPase n=1 Tax=Bosea sp. (in: a-proteobacteria) TaxID=1871050 RepID=UPI00262AEE80|nr:type I secretion system permease/ATPase [Bosea sp. (in: a-proteobacteria)]MCO5090685.1 type I secretion system permease/ATPase [Bosea sp. (in: a-proteobacteria)]
MALRSAGSFPGREQNELANPLTQLTRAFRSTLAVVILLSCAVNVLTLTGSWFMLEVYDRVVPSHSVPTLVGLIVILVVLVLFQGAMEYVRTRILVRIGAAFDEAFGRPAHAAVLEMSLRTMRFDEGGQAIRDLDQIRTFVGSPGLIAFFDLPWIPIYVGFCMLLHPWIAYAAVAGACVLIGLSILAEVLTRDLTKSVSVLGAQRGAMVESARRNAEVLHGMGFAGRFSEMWNDVSRDYVNRSVSLVDRATAISILSRSFRMLLQSLVLALGGYLAIKQEISSGAIVAGSIIAGRALAPIDLAIANWRGVVAARESWRRLSRLLALFPERLQAFALPKPEKSLAIDGISLAPPGSERLVLSDVGFSLSAGSGLAVIGPSGSGKSSLIRAIVGVWKPAKGRIKLDGAALDQWSDEARAEHLGYLPQNVDLFAGTVAQNISRFAAAPSSEAIIAAARRADVHDLILNLPQGYETKLGEGGANLSAGQRQRIALARALYGEPFLIVLDEPNSNLDAEGEQALAKAITEARSRGAIVVVVAHRSQLLASVDLVAVIAEGRLQTIGPRDEVMARLTARAPSGPPLKVVSETGTGG